MSKYTTDELTDVILQVANSLQLISDALNAQKNAFLELTKVMENINQMILYLPDEIKSKLEEMESK